MTRPEWADMRLRLNSPFLLRHGGRWLLVAVATLIAFIAVTAPASGQPASRPFLKIVQLGDSYSAGNGAGEDYWGPRGCWRSTRSWGEKYADSLRAQNYAVHFVNRACSGATTVSLFDPTFVDDEEIVISLNIDGGPFDENDPALKEAIQALDICQSDYVDEESYVIEIMSATFFPNPPPLTGGFTRTSFRCDRTVAAQIDAVGSDTDLVLLTTGGNDAKFGDIVRQCFLLGVANEPSCQGAFDDANDHLDAGLFEQHLTELLTTLRVERGLPASSRIALVSYPYLEAGTGVHYPSLDVSQAIRALGDKGDVEQQQAVTAANNAAGFEQNVFLTTVKPAFGGPPGPAGHEPFGLWWEVNSDRWIYEWERGFPLGFGNYWENYHPNPQGHTELATLLTAQGTFGVTGTPIDGGDIDVVFAIDTTGSMGDDINAVKSFAGTFVDSLTQSFDSFRFALVTYRDHPSWTGDPSDYPARLELDFTDDESTITSSINAIEVDGGGDTPESVYSGLMEGINLAWRPGVKKIIVQLGDAPPHDPEPVTDLTAQDVIDAALAVDPAEVYVLNVSSGGAAPPALAQIASGTGGAVFSAPSPSEVASALIDLLEQAASKPLALAGGPYIATVGSSRVLDGSDSVDGDGSIVSYEWDLDGDGDYDTMSSQPTYTYTFAAAFDGTIALRVTDDDGLSSVATARAHASSDGDEVPALLDNCPNAPNHGQDDFDADGVGDVCDSTPGYQLESAQLCQGLQPTRIGTPGADTINGTSGNDVILGLDGNDVISGLGGADVICGGPGVDRLDGGDASDRLYGESGNDNLEGKKGDDWLIGGTGTDTFNGGAGSDRCFFETGETPTGCEW